MAVVCKRCNWCAKHVGTLNLLGNIGLLCIKLLGGIFGRSQALIADAVHSLSDVIVSVMMLVTLKVSAVPPDEDHHWGHGNVEYIASAVIGILLICAAITITVASLASIIEGDMSDPGILAVWAAVISIFGNGILCRQGICIGEQMDSPVMIANAREKRSDAYSSFAALIGVFGAKIGFKFLDPIAAIVVGLMIARFGLDTLLEGVKGISDRSFDKETLAGVKRLVLKEKGIRNINQLRARQIGQKNWIDFEATFDPEMKVSEVKNIIGGLRKNIMDRFDGVADVVIISRASGPELKEIQ
ncbi:MAG: cation transporter [Desulfobacteraceae bacterium]|nr:cation transporter [Desulfobacteraceae bacterium]